MKRTNLKSGGIGSPRSASNLYMSIARGVHSWVRSHTESQTVWSGVCSFRDIALTEPCHRLTRDIRPVRSGEMELCPVTYRLIGVSRTINIGTNTSNFGSDQHALSLQTGPLMKDYGTFSDKGGRI